MYLGSTSLKYILTTFHLRLKETKHLAFSENPCHLSAVQFRAEGRCMAPGYTLSLDCPGPSSLRLLLWMEQPR